MMQMKWWFVRVVGLPEPPVPAVTATGAAVSVMLAAVAAGCLVDVAVPVELGYTVLNS